MYRYRTPRNAEYCDFTTFPEMARTKSMEHVWDMEKRSLSSH